MDKQDLWVLDGGMGRELARRGAPFRQPEWSALALMEAPETVREVHQAYDERCPGDHHQQLCPGALPYRRGTLCRPAGGTCGSGRATGPRRGRRAGGAVKVAGSLPPLLAPIVRTSIRPSG